MNEIVKRIDNGNEIIFILNTKGNDDYWWWSVCKADVENYNGNEEQFVNDCDNANLGCSCASFNTIEDAIADANGNEKSFEDIINDLHSKGLHLECGFGCEFLGFTCNGNPECNPCCPYSVVVDSNGNEIDYEW